MKQWQPLEMLTHIEEDLRTNWTLAKRLIAPIQKPTRFEKKNCLRFKIHLIKL